MLLILLTLIAIFLFDRTFGKAFDSQRSNKDIFRKELRGIQRAKEMLSSNQANFYTNPRKSETNDCSTFDRFSVPIPNDVSAFMQLSVPNDIPAITTSSFKQLIVPTIATLIDPWTCDNSLSFYFNTINATSTAKLTCVSATTTAQMNSSALNPATHTTSLFLLRNEDNSEIMIPSLLLPFNQDNPAITTVTHAHNLLLYAQIGSAITTATHAQNLLLFFVRNDPANSKLHLIVAFIRRASTAQTNVDLISVSEGEHLITPATIHNVSFKLIDTLASEGGALCSEGAHPAPTILSDKLCGHGLIVDFIPTTSNPLLPPVLNEAIAPAHQSNLHVESKSKLIVICFKIFLHFREDCRTFCEGERDDPCINGLVKRNVLIGLWPHLSSRPHRPHRPHHPWPHRPHWPRTRWPFLALLASLALTA